jgi:hypothetical protein
MLPKTESACFVIADISGYTSFLAGVELDHAHDIIADVMDTVVRCLRPPFRLAKFEGDAAFFYAVSDKVDGSLLQDAIESAYFAFRKRLRNIKQATSCACSACRNIQNLDLKFVSHHGEFIKHRMAGREELAGRDVIVVHRLLKNAVNERLGGHTYAPYSDPCVQAMDVDPLGRGRKQLHRSGLSRLARQDRGALHQSPPLGCPHDATASQAGGAHQRTGALHGDGHTAGRVGRWPPLGRDQRHVGA